MMKNKKKKCNDEVFEDWHKEEYEEDPDNAPKYFQKPPKKYETNFLQKLDRRTASYQILNDGFNEVVSDMGGLDGLSHVQKSLAERYIFLEFVLRNVEKQMARNPKKSEELLSRWIQGLNSLTGLARTIGLHRKAKKIDSLQSYVRSKKNA